MLNDKWRNSTLVKLMKLGYADLFPTRRCLKMDKQMLLRRLEEYKGESLFRIE